MTIREMSFQLRGKPSDTSLVDEALAHFCKTVRESVRDNKCGLVTVSLNHDPAATLASIGSRPRQGSGGGA